MPRTADRRPETEPPDARGLNWAPVRVAVGVLLVGLLAYVAYLVINNGGEIHPLWDRGLYCLLLFLCTGIVLARAALVERERAAWAFIGINLLLWALGEAIYAGVWADDPNAPYPSIADALEIATYPFLFIGLGLLLRDRVRRFERTMWLDGSVAALTVGAFGATFVLPKVVSSGDGMFLPDATTIAYPAGDTIALGFVIAILVLVGMRAERSWFVLLASLAIMPVIDGVYSYQEATGGYVEGGLGDFLWPLAAALLAISAWLPIQRDTASAPRGWRSLATPSFFALIDAGLLLYGYTASVPPVAVGLAGVSLMLAVGRLALTYRDNQQLFERAHTDALTQLGNRSALMLDLQDALSENGGSRARMLVMLDLNGFKLYNDSFGHPAGDALLSRLAGRFANTARSHGKAYRIGGDEFCALLECSADQAAGLASRVAAAMNESGEGFEVSAARGSVLLHEEASQVSTALQLADRRMYQDKNSSRSSARSQAHEVLMRTLREREPELGVHVDQVAELATAVSRRLGVDADELDVITRAAALHDIGKMAIPDAVLNKPSALDEEEWRFIRDHTLVGERILREAPALAPVAELVRSSHERWDGDGYPDGLTGERIPLGARIIFVADAFNAMISDRPYAAALGVEDALAELDRCSGTQFDPAVVEQLCIEVRSAPPIRAPVGAKADGSR